MGKLRLPAVLESIPRAIQCVTRSAQAAGLSGRALHQIQVAVDEACANIVQHAYAGMQPGAIEISCAVDDGRFVIRLRDWGRSFDPQSVDEPDVEAPLEERTLGGLGLFLIRQFVDEAHFTFDPEAGNELTMVKIIDPPPSASSPDSGLPPAGETTSVEEHAGAVLERNGEGPALQR
jgi:serine/threonine-protein kinase RsbW